MWIRRERKDFVSTKDRIKTYLRSEGTQNFLVGEKFLVRGGRREFFIRVQYFFCNAEDAKKFLVGGIVNFLFYTCAESLCVYNETFPCFAGPFYLRVGFLLCDR